VTGDQWGNGLRDSGFGMKGSPLILFLGGARKIKDRVIIGRKAVRAYNCSMVSSSQN
jgi:hypothetical protein